MSRTNHLRQWFLASNTIPTHPFSIETELWQVFKGLAIICFNTSEESLKLIYPYSFSLNKSTAIWLSRGSTGRDCWRRTLREQEARDNPVDPSSNETCRNTSGQNYQLESNHWQFLRPQLLHKTVWLFASGPFVSPFYPNRQHSRKDLVWWTKVLELLSYSPQIIEKKIVGSGRKRGRGKRSAAACVPNLHFQPSFKTSS